jgi:hypothetical protein
VYNFAYLLPVSALVVMCCTIIIESECTDLCQNVTKGQVYRNHLPSAVGVSVGPSFPPIQFLYRILTCRFFSCVNNVFFVSCLISVVSVVAVY